MTAELLKRNKRVFAIQPEYLERFKKCHYFHKMEGQPETAWWHPTLGWSHKWAPASAVVELINTQMETAV